MLLCVQAYVQVRRDGAGVMGVHSEALFTYTAAIFDAIVPNTIL